MRSSLLSIGLVLALAHGARGDTDPWPTDADARITAQIAACEGDRPDVCDEVAAAMTRAGIAKRLGRTPADLRARGQAALDARCTSGTADACWERGRSLRAHGDGGADDLIARGCELGSGDACLDRALHTRDRAKSLALLRTACDHGRGDACELIATRAGGDAATVLALHRQACDGGAVAGCQRAGELDRAAHDPRALDDFTRACDAASAAHLDADAMRGCDDAGLLTSDAVQARARFQLACDAGDALACEHLGERIARGQGGPRDWGAGLAQIADACKRTHDRACRALAELKRHPPDWSCATEDECRARCDEELWPACRRAVELAAPDDRDPDLLERACAGGDAIGCRMRGDAAEAFADALPWYRRGCALHEDRACGYVAFDRARRSGATAAMKAACAKDPAACPLYGIAIAKRDAKRAADAWRGACEAKVGVACRFLARTFDDASNDGDDAMIELVLGGSKPGFGDCGCDDGATPPAKDWAEQEQRRDDEAQRLLHAACVDGDARACEDTLGDARLVAPPVTPVALPAWE
jgi:hypothetical protein